MNNQSPKCPKCGGMLQYTFDPEIEHCHNCNKDFTVFRPCPIDEVRAAVNAPKISFSEALKWEQVFGGS